MDAGPVDAGGARFVTSEALGIRRQAVRMVCGDAGLR
jgi:hypothetical protein